MSSTFNKILFNLLNMKDYDLKNLAGRISWRMAECGIPKPASLAKEAHVSRATVTLWLNGTTKRLEGPNLIKLAKVLKCNADWLQTGTGPWAENESRPHGSIPAAEQDEAYYELPNFEPMVEELLGYFDQLTYEHQLDLIAQAKAWSERDNQHQKEQLTVKKRRRGM
jgi:transcriptional regulator with XRE-family HTH domain